MSQDGADRLVEWVDNHSDQILTALRATLYDWEQIDGPIGDQQVESWRRLIDEFEERVEALDD